MWTVVVKAYRAAGLVLAFTQVLDVHAESGRPVSDYLDVQRWMHAADVAANEGVTYEVCGWGVIDLRTSLLSSAIEQGVDVLAWDELAKRYDEATRERRRTEAVLTAHGMNAPMQRTIGFHLTGGCTDAVRARIEKQAKPNVP